MKGGLYLQSNYDLLFYKTYRRNGSEYCFEFGNERKEDFRMQEERPNLPAYLKSGGFYL